MNFNGSPVTGFTLELDGSPDEVQRILKAVGDEMSQIASENMIDQGVTLRGMPITVTLPPRHSLVGTLTVRSKAHALPI